jgi:hypothetical protein
MSLWEFLAQVEGYIEANTPEDKKNSRLTVDEREGIARWLRGE